MGSKRELVVADYGELPMASARRIQQALYETQDKDFLMVCSHPPTYSMGSQASNTDIRDPQARSICVKVDRGGKTTFHGPGQVIIYPIMSLSRFSPSLRVVDYIRGLEQAILGALSRFSLECRPDPGRTGVWSGEGKIASIGIRVKRYRTLHGLAVNHSVDKAWFRNIVACGEANPQVANLSDYFGTIAPVSIQVLERALLDSIRETFGFGALRLGEPGLPVPPAAADDRC